MSTYPMTVADCIEAIAIIVWPGSELLVALDEVGCGAVDATLSRHRGSKSYSGEYRLGIHSVGVKSPKNERFQVGFGTSIYLYILSQSWRTSSHLSLGQLYVDLSAPTDECHDSVAARHIERILRTNVNIPSHLPCRAFASEK